MKRTSHIIASLYIVGLLVLPDGLQGKGTSLSSLITQLNDGDARVRYSDDLTRTRMDYWETAL